MPLIDNILFLNEQHSTIVRGHLADMEGVINSVTFFDEDYVVNRDYNTSGRALYLGFKSEF